MLERVWGEGNPLTLLVGMQTGTDIIENSVENPLKPGIELLYNSAIPLLGTVPVSFRELTPAFMFLAEFQRAD